MANDPWALVWPYAASSGDTRRLEYDFRAFRGYNFVRRILRRRLAVSDGVDQATETGAPKIFRQGFWPLDHAAGNYSGQLPPHRQRQLAGIRGSGNSSC